MEGPACLARQAKMLPAGSRERGEDYFEKTAIS
jgi:hypothetical protein